MTADDATYRVHIQLLRVRPPLWRRVEVPGSMTLDRLRLVVDTVMGWPGAGGEFVVGGSTRDPWSTPVRPLDVLAAEIARDRRTWSSLGFSAADLEVVEDDLLVEEQLTVRDVLPRDRSTLQYAYGIAWEHRLRVERITPGGAPPRPRCLAGRRAAPAQYLVNGWNYTEVLRLARAVAEGHGTPQEEAALAAHMPGLSPQEAWAALDGFDVLEADGLLRVLHEQGRV
ncbi:MAG: plasmid pRiA4b ORF-3 family protein [Actinotalea sp.]|nr:plasmid pRiA4b ORF-3 family protein [Actinotalea sp.]